MDEFKGVCKILITTDTFNKDKSPYILCTVAENYTQNKSVVEFDYKKIFDRQDKYKDVVGFYHTHPAGFYSMSSTDISTMEQWVKCLGKSLICLIECDGVMNSWLFSKGEDNEISVIEVKASTTNNINYYVWTEPTPSFWQDADFLTKGEAYYSEDEITDPITEIIDRLENLEAGVLSIVNALDALTTAIQIGLKSSDDELEDSNNIT